MQQKFTRKRTHNSRRLTNFGEECGSNFKDVFIENYAVDKQFLGARQSTVKNGLIEAIKTVF